MAPLAVIAEPVPLLLEDDRGSVFFEWAGDVYRAPASSPRSATTGYPMGARWFGPPHYWRDVQANGLYPLRPMRRHDGNEPEGHGRQARDASGRGRDREAQLGNQGRESDGVDEGARRGDRPIDGAHPSDRARDVNATATDQERLQHARREMREVADALFQRRAPVQADRHELGRRLNSAAAGLRTVELHLSENLALIAEHIEGGNLDAALALARRT